MKPAFQSLESASSPNKFTAIADRSATPRRKSRWLRAVEEMAFDGLQRGAAALGFGIATYRQDVRSADFAQVASLRRTRSMLLTPLEGVQLINAVKATSQLSGCMAEVGVFQGGSARLIRQADRRRVLHLFDTFTGLPEASEADGGFRFGQFRRGDFACSLESVTSYLSDLSQIEYHPGLFPETGAGLEDARFSFVHIDVDLYESSIRSVEWFYPRMVTGGIIISHDFGTCAGPRKALTEFFAHKPEPLIELPGDQALFVKC